MGVLDEEGVSVLDHGYVRYVTSMGHDEDIVAAARMSTGKGFLGWEPGFVCEHCKRGVINVAGQGVCAASPDALHKFVEHKGDAGLLEYLYKNQHHTPFEMCELAIEVKAPIFVFREWHRHRTQSFNEFSARYSVMPNEHYAPESKRFSSKTSANKQESSLKVPVLVTRTDELSATFNDTQGWADYVDHEQRKVYAGYEQMIEAGVPKEVARINTPVSRYSKMRAKTDLRNWLGFLKLRDHDAAQFEIRQYAQAVASIVKEIWPRTYALYEEYTKYAVTLSKSEAETAAWWLQPDEATNPNMLTTLKEKLDPNWHPK